MLEINNLNKSYNNISILKDFCLNINENSIVGLTGPSGSGKSILLRCIQGLERIDSGTVSCSGKVGFIFQDFQLFPHFTVLENITYAPIKVLHKPQNLVIQEAYTLLNQLGLLEHKNKYPAALSGGQKQRVAVSRALIMHPELLLCDEPTSGLDLGLIASVKQLLWKVHELGVVVLVASHDINFLVEICSRILVLKQGSIVNDLINSNPENSIAILKNTLIT